MIETRPRILVVCQHFWPETFGINAIADAFRDRGYDVDVLCGIPNYPKGHFFDGYSLTRNRRQLKDRIRIRRVAEIPRGSNTNFRVFVNYISFPIASLFHLPKLLAVDYDRIFLYQLSPVMMSLAGIIVGRLRRIQTTMYVLDLWPENLFSVLPVRNSLLRRLVTAISHWHYRQVDKLIALSGTMQAKLDEIAGLPRARTLVLPQSCDKIYERAVYDEELGSRFKDGFNVVFAGNISPAQDFATLISAARRLREDGIDDVNWIIVGDGMSRRQVEDDVRSAGLERSFHFEGFVPPTEVVKYHGVADILYAGLVRSDLLGATIPAKVISYFAAGRPIVLAMDGEPQDLVNSVRCGFAGASGDSHAVYQNIRALYSMAREERKVMGQRAREYYFSNFEEGIVLDRLCRFVMDDDAASSVK